MLPAVVRLVVTANLMKGNIMKKQWILFALLALGLTIDGCKSNGKAKGDDKSSEETKKTDKT